MSVSPVASICIATYNKSSYLDRTLHSVFNQTPGFTFEVIVTDDGSPNDHTKRVCDKYPVRYLRNDRPPGFTNPAKARNMSMRVARAPIIIQQSDDVIMASPDVITRLVDELKLGTFQIATVYEFFHETGKIGVEYTPTLAGKTDNRPFFFLGSCWRSDIFEIGGYDEDFVTAGYDDNWHADCLIKGLGLVPIWSTTLGLHQMHPRPNYDWAPALAVYNRKIAAGVFKSNDAPWR